MYFAVWNRTAFNALMTVNGRESMVRSSRATMIAILRISGDQALIKRRLRSRSRNTRGDSATGNLKINAILRYVFTGLYLRAMHVRRIKVTSTARSMWRVIFLSSSWYCSLPEMYGSSPSVDLDAIGCDGPDNRNEREQCHVLKCVISYCSRSQLTGGCSNRMRRGQTSFGNCLFVGPADNKDPCDSHRRTNCCHL